jgi:hypothetical protein
LFRVQAGDIFLKLCYDQNRNRTRAHTLSGLLASRGDITFFKVNVRDSQ